MGENIIYYGPPGTGKTFLMQTLRQKYTDFAITDDQIKDAFIKSSQDWILITLVLLQNNNLLSSTEIEQRIQQLNIPGFTEDPSTVLSTHSEDLHLLFTPRPPTIFKEDSGKWYVIYNKLLEYDTNFVKNYLSENSVNERFKFVTFHQSFTYEDFIEGIRPEIENSEIEKPEIENRSTTSASNSGDIKYKIQDGIFKKLCDIAKKNRTKEYAIFIDEINRGNISEIFGDLISLIEIDKRLKMPHQLKVHLPYSKSDFGVPQNISIYGTMNSADRSIALIDVALRRRFEFVQMNYDLDLLKLILHEQGVNATDINGIDLIDLLSVINKRIQILLDENFVIGHAYFTTVTSFEELKEVFVKKVIPLLEEYFFDDLEKVQLILADLNQDGELESNAIYKSENLEVDNLFKYKGDFNIESKKRYFISASITEESFKKIYS